jgi:hypothetical protein
MASRCCPNTRSWNAPSPGSAVARHLARDFERYARTNVAFIRLAMIRTMLRRIAASPSA